MLIVGPIVEAPVDVVVGSTPVATNDGTGYDFAINDLRFKVAPTDKNPYQRATAQFKKDQFDAGTQVGDQSLTGWWTRGEFSFHRGAGITYYEVSQGDTILNRYLDADGVYPWETGELSLQKSWNDYSASVTSVSYVSELGSGLVVLDGTTAKYGDFNGSPTSLSPTGGGTTRAVCTSPTLGYVLTTAGKISSFTTGGTQAGLYAGLTSTGRGIWYVKSRLIVSDSDGKWYALSTNPTAPPVTVGAGDVIFTATDWATSSVVCDTPGPVLIGNSNRVFAVSVDSSTGSIPSLAAPVQIAELPPGETISGLASHLGFIIIVTGAGVRVGVLSDSGQLTYGPLLVERSTPTATPPVTSVARYSTIAAVVVDNRIIEIDLSQQVGSTLEFGWSGRGTPISSNATAAGVTTFQIGTQVAWDNDKIWASDPALMAGWLQTGYHRFATLENKRFDSVKFTAEGTHGTILVSKVTDGGTLTSLYTMDVSRQHQVEVSLQATAGEELLGLRFDLTPDPAFPTSSPVLLGYQIRALPEPQRQRMIRVPLAMYDSERRQPTRTVGHGGFAWERLSALENLENAGAIVMFQDFRTGESGRAYVESVEFSNITPPTNKSSGFGGTCFITLRKL